MWSDEVVSPLFRRRMALSIALESENAVHAPTCPWSLLGPSVPSFRWSTASGSVPDTGVSGLRRPRSISCTLRALGGLAADTGWYSLQSMWIQWPGVLSRVPHLLFGRTLSRRACTFRCTTRLGAGGGCTTRPGRRSITTLRSAATGGGGGAG